MSTISRRLATVCAAVLLAATTAACTSHPSPKESPGERPTSAQRPDGCPEVRWADVRGHAPGYLRTPLAETPNDAAMCAGWWLPRTAGAPFVPQGIAVRGNQAWVSGYDAAAIGQRYCRVVRMSLRTGAAIAERADFTEAPGVRPPCRHGGGVMLDDDGLWMAEKTRLWLLDPSTLEVRRFWRFELPVWGSYLLHDDRGRLGVGGFGRRARLYWFRPGDLLAAGRSQITGDLAVQHRKAPRSGQGAFFAKLPGSRKSRVWFVRSHTRCGVLESGKRRLGFLPGAEGTTYVGGQLYVASESTSEHYFKQGGRPVIPQIARYDLSTFTTWQKAHCEP